jgi:subtilase family serine protease
MPFAFKLIKARTKKLIDRFRMRLNVEQLENRTLLSVFAPGQITHAYGIDQIAFNGGKVKGDGSGQTVAIVDAYYDATVQQDLAGFSSTFGLPQLDGLNGNGKFSQVDLSNQIRSPAGNDWTLETALDVEWAHAVAPKANILLVSAANDAQDPTTGEPTALLDAVHTAATTSGVSTVSMSWGISEVPGETSWDSVFSTPGVTFVASSGDSGAETSWPAVSPNVVSVGGTTLKLTSSNTIASETGWGHGDWSAYDGGSGGGFSQYEKLPSYQSNISTVTNGWKLTSFGVRLSPDVAYVGNPSTGLYVLDSADGGWYQVGGTSAGAPQWASLIAIADQGRALAGQAPLSSTQTLSALYANPAGFHDITQGNTGTYYVVNNFNQVVGTIPVAAGKGYDMVTGLGTPIANVLVPSLAGVTAGARADTTHTATKTLTSSSSTGSSSSKSSETLAIPTSFFGVVGPVPFVQPSSLTTTSTSAVFSPTLPPPVAVNPQLSVPTTATSPIVTRVESGGGQDSILDDSADNQATPQNSMPDDSNTESMPDAPQALPSAVGDPGDLYDAGAWRAAHDAYFASLAATDFSTKSTPIAPSVVESILLPRNNDVARATIVGLLFATYWGTRVRTENWRFQEKRHIGLPR